MSQARLHGVPHGSKELRRGKVYRDSDYHPLAMTEGALVCLELLFCMWTCRPVLNYHFTYVAPPPPPPSPPPAPTCSSPQRKGPGHCE